MTTRRGFLAGILASGFAPAVVGSSVLMPVKKIVVRNQAFSDFFIESVYLKGPPPVRILESFDVGRGLTKPDNFILDKDHWLKDFPDLKNPFLIDLRIANR